MTQPLIAYKLIKVSIIFQEGCISLLYLSWVASHYCQPCAQTAWHILGKQYKAGKTQGVPEAVLSCSSSLPSLWIIIIADTLKTNLKIKAKQANAKQRSKTPFSGEIFLIFRFLWERFSLWLTKPLTTYLCFSSEWFLGFKGFFFVRPYYIFYDHFESKFSRVLIVF